MPRGAARISVAKAAAPKPAATGARGGHIVRPRRVVFPARKMRSRSASRFRDDLPRRVAERLVVRVVRPVDGRVDVDGHRARAHRERLHRPDRVGARHGHADDRHAVLPRAVEEGRLEGHELRRVLARLDSFVDVGAQSIALREDGDGIAGLEVRRRVRQQLARRPLDRAPAAGALRVEAHGEVAARCMAQPPKGTLNKSDLATYLVSKGRIAAANANGSKSERWLQTTMTALLPLI